MHKEKCDHIWKQIERPVEVHGKIFADVSWRQCIKCDRIEYRREIVLEMVSALQDVRRNHKNAKDLQTIKDRLKDLRRHEEKINVANRQAGTIRYYEGEFYLENIRKAEIENMTFKELLMEVGRLLEELTEMNDETKKREIES